MTSMVLCTGRKAVGRGTKPPKDSAHPPCQADEGPSQKIDPAQQIGTCMDFKCIQHVKAASSLIRGSQPTQPYAWPPIR